MIYTDCQMKQASRTVSYPKGTYRGRTIIDGVADLTHSWIQGEVVLNGRRIIATRL